MNEQSGPQDAAESRPPDVEAAVNGKGHPLRRASDRAAARKAGLRRLSETVSHVWSVGTKTAISAFVLVLLAITVWEVSQDSILIDPIQIPKELAARGYTPEIVAQRVADEMLRIRNQVNAAQGQMRGVPTLEDPEPRIDLQRNDIALDVSIPGTGISLRSAIRSVREFVGLHGPRIGGEITRDNGQLWLRLRARGDRVIADLPAPVGTPDPQATSASGSAQTEVALADLLRSAAREVVKQTDPYLMAVYIHLFEQDPAAAMAAVELSLQDENEGDDAWAHNLGGLVRLEQARALASSPEGATDAVRTLFDQAAERFDRAIRVRADLHAPYNNRGNVSFFTGRYDEAIEYYRKATTLKTSYAAGFQNLGLALLRTRQHEEAVAAYREALEIYEEAEDQTPELLFHRGFAAALYEAGRYGEAAGQYERIVALTVDHPETAGRAYLDWGDAIAKQREIASGQGLPAAEIKAMREDAIAKYQEAGKLHGAFVWPAQVRIGKLSPE